MKREVERKTRHAAEATPLQRSTRHAAEAPLQRRARHAAETPLQRRARHAAETPLQRRARHAAETPLQRRARHAAEATPLQRRARHAAEAPLQRSTRRVAETTPLQEPHRWCDRDCNRCPLVSACPANAGGAPPSWAGPQDGLQRIAVAHATAMVGVLDEAVAQGRLERGVASAICVHAFAAAARVGRILAVDDEAAIAHLLVLEHYLARVDTGILSVEGVLPVERLQQQRRARWELGRRLEPAMARIRSEHRAQLKRMQSAGCAPSPLHDT